MSLININKILIANRGEIACRVIDTCHRLGIQTVAVYSDADAEARHVTMADEAIYIGASPAAESYLIADKIITAAKDTGADAIHPGYGFLSENADFADRCAAEGIKFIGPKGDSIRAMGLKGTAKQLMVDAGVPVVPGYHGDDQDPATLKKAADDIGYPVLIKAVAGGGGKGMRKVMKAEDFDEALQSAKREGANSFGNDVVLIEKFIEKPRHIEIQVFGDSHGEAVYLFERDCSLQRRHQKVVEEAPAPGMPEEMRRAMGEAAVKAAKAIDYEGAGTIEFIVDASKGLNPEGFYFMEMNTRLQVEHPVTEMITGTDLVEWQISVAEGHPLPMTQSELSINGHSIEVRLYAEDPAKNFMPQTGKLDYFHVDIEDDMRLETGVVQGDEISVFYDPMIAKLVVHGPTRDDALDAMMETIRNTHVAGLKTNLAFLLNCVEHEDFGAANFDTNFIDQNIELLTEAAEDDLSDDILLALVARQSMVMEEAIERVEASPEPNSPFNSMDGWRMNIAYHEPLTLLDEHGTAHEVIIGMADDGVGYDITLGGECYYINGYITADGEIEAQIDDAYYYAHLWHDDNHITIMRDGRTVPLTVLLHGDEDDSSAAGPGGINAPMPGRILDVLVADGDTVTTDQTLVIMEAMKMEYSLKAPRDGVVSGLTVKANDQVADGDLILTVTEASED